MAKIKINKLPKGFKLLDGKVVEEQVMRDGGDLQTGDQADYGLVTTPQEYYNNTNFNNTDDRDVRYSLSSVPRENANIEAEGGETVLTDLTNDGTFGLYDITGPRHSKGGVPMFLPEQSFIYSDTDKMKFTSEELSEFGINSKKKITPAKLSKKYQLNDYYNHLTDPYADNIQALTSELMLKKNMMNLSKLAFTQESKKKFEEGVPLAAHPYLVQQGIDPIQFTAEMEQISREQAEMEAIAALPPEQQQQVMMMQQMMAQEQEQPQQPQGQEMQTEEMMMQEDAMARFGGERKLKRYQKAGETGKEYSERMGQTWDPTLKNPTYDKKNKMWVYGDGTPSVSKSDAMRMAMSGQKPSQDYYISETELEGSVNTNTQTGGDNVEVLETEITESSTPGTGNPGIPAEQWAIWKPYIDNGATLETITLDDGRKTVRISTPKSDVQKLREQVTATNLVGRGGTTDIYGEDISGQGRAIKEGTQEGWVYKEGPLTGGQRNVTQAGVDGVYGSSDINSETTQTIFRDNWGDTLEKIEEQFGVPFDNTNDEQVLAFQTAAEEQRKLDAAAAGVDYIPYFKKPGDEGYVKGQSLDGKMGLYTINIPRLSKNDQFNDEATYGDITKDDLVPGEIDVKERGQPEWWIQDQNNLNALGQIDDNLYLPWAPDAQRVTLAPTFDDWRSAVNSNNSTASTIAQALGAVGGPQAVANSQIQGQTLEANAKAINRTNTNNVGIANQYGAMQAQYDNLANQENDKRKMAVYDNTQKTLQAHDNFLNWKIGENVKLQNAALTNRANTFNLNSTYDNYEIDPRTGGIIDFTDPRALEKQGPVADQKSRERDYFEGVTSLAKNLNREPTSAEIEGFFDYTRGSGKPAYRDPNISNAAAELQKRGAPGRSVNANVNTQTARKGKELKRMVVPFYSGKMGR
jgi:hypothetical protein